MPHLVVLGHISLAHIGARVGFTRVHVGATEVHVESIWILVIQNKYDVHQNNQHDRY